jgi:DNA-binding NtrC family response regulator
MSRNARREPAANHPEVRIWRDPFLGTSESIQRLKSMAQSILGTSLPILIQGETGTGKGVLADWLTQHGPRSGEAFLELNCAGLSRELWESELFGQEERGFNGAITYKAGVLENAHRGTLFLDELGDMDLQIQPKLLQLLDKGRFRRVGGARDREVDIHVIASSHRDLAALVAHEQFRPDLFFRVSAMSLLIPPLRSRIDDVPVIAQCFLEQFEREGGYKHLELGKGVTDALKSYNWPGNLRELHNLLERAALLCKEGIIRREDLQFQFPTPMPTAAQPAQFVPRSGSGDKELTLRELERQYISYILQKENGKASRAALKLGIPQTTFYAKLKRFNISARSD